VNAGDIGPPTHSPLRVPGACQFNGTFTGWHPGAGGAKRSETERASDPAVSWYARTRAMTDETSKTAKMIPRPAMTKRYATPHTAIARVARRPMKVIQAGLPLKAVTR
jgi:hypothetical protein